MPIQLELPQGFYDEIQEALRGVYRHAIEQARRDIATVKEYLTVAEASELHISASETLIRKWIAENGLPKYEIGGKTYIKKQDLYDFIERHRQ